MKEFLNRRLGEFSLFAEEEKPEISNTQNQFYQQYRDYV